MLFLLFSSWGVELEDHTQFLQSRVILLDLRFFFCFLLFSLSFLFFSFFLSLSRRLLTELGLVMHFLSLGLITFVFFQQFIFSLWYFFIFIYFVVSVFSQATSHKKKTKKKGKPGKKNLLTDIPPPLALLWWQVFTIFSTDPIKNDS